MDNTHLRPTPHPSALIQRAHADFRPSRAGFTLLELVLVVCIMALLAAMAAPRYANSLSYYRADLGAKRVAADLAMARSNAWAAGTQRTTTFTTNTNSYVLSGIRGLNQATTDCTVSISSEPYNAQIFSASFEGQPSVTFDGYGMPNRGGQIVIRAGSFQQTVTLDRNSGNVSVP